MDMLARWVALSLTLLLLGACRADTAEICGSAAAAAATSERVEMVPAPSPGGATLGTFPVGQGPIVIAFDGTNIWVANKFSDSLTKLSLTGTTLGTYAVGPSPEGIAFDGCHMWVTSYPGSNAVTVL
jgi:hypothetical protein